MINREKKKKKKKKRKTFTSWQETFNSFIVLYDCRLYGIPERRVTAVARLKKREVSQFRVSATVGGQPHTTRRRCSVPGPLDRQPCKTAHCSRAQLLDRGEKFSLIKFYFTLFPVYCTTSTHFVLAFPRSFSYSSYS